ncbi:AbiU2 domain-containing protein [Ochrobactrum teleogrylli]|uniref:HEPN AbiU2-like domain-containing protein n=1 Tax=Ochrobactrum teleogrylli TaxID=2479765 RepID=A0ABD5JYS9_9HYPH
MAKAKSASNPFDNFTPRQRVEVAQKRISILIDNILHWLLLRESNNIAIFSNTLSKQIPRSNAATAFNVLTDSLYRFEIIRLCTFWDKASKDRISIPTIVALLDNAETAEIVGENAYRSASDPGHWMGGSNDVDRAIQRMLKENALKRAETERIEAISNLTEVIKEAVDLASNTKIIGLRSFRDNYLAHSLVPNGSEKAIEVVRYGDENDVFEDTKRLVLRLHQIVNLTDFMFEDSRKMARRNAEELWNNCTFSIPARSR